MTIPQLSKYWLSEKEMYKTSEVGSGVQKFVKEVFKSSEIFNLTEGKLSTSLNKRQYEFIEEAQKKGHRADVVIFVNSDIIIPVEIEKYNNIKQGENQIFQYMADWQKKLGLLTDGYEWRFYNNLYIEKIFFIDDILNKTDEFQVFWKEYTTPEYYYQSFFDKKDKKKEFEFTPPNIDDVRQDFFLDIAHLIETFKNKLNLKGYFSDAGDESEMQKKAVEITYAYLIQFILYKTLVDNAFTEFENDWNARITSISKALKAEIYGDILQKVKGISDKISEKIYHRFNDEQLLINQRLTELLKQPNQEIKDASVWLDILLLITRYNFSNVQNEIFGYVYENYLKELYLDEKKGQYFTDPEVVEFMLDEIGFTKEELKKRYNYDKNSLSIIDPSCGSGTFLYNATSRLIDSFFDGSINSSELVEKLVIDNIFGLDIAEFPLYLAEMNILMRLLPVIINEKFINPLDLKIKVFKTKDSISEFLDTSILNTLTDYNKEYKEKGVSQLNLFSQALDLGYDSYVRDKRDLEDVKYSLETHENISRLRFDFVIGNPPYVGYNECSKQGVLIFKFIKEGLIKLNNIYGFNLHSTPDNTKKYRPNPNLYSFFICLGTALLKEDGIISFIVPQTIINAGDLDVIRYHLSKFFTIEKIILFESKMFIKRGLKQNKIIPTSSLIFVIKKSIPKHNHNVKVIIFEEQLESIKKIQSKKKIPQSLLLKNYQNWSFIKFSERIIKFIDIYNRNNDSMAYYYQHSLAEESFNSKFIFDGGYDIDETKRITDIPNEEYYIYPKFKSDSYTKIVPSGYWLNHRNNTESHYISLRQGNQDYLLLDSKYKIVWSYINPKLIHFTDKKIIWARNQFNSIGSNNKNELIYLFALLNSRVNFTVLKSFLTSKNEKDYLFSLNSIKNFIKVPIISDNNKHIKTEIIKYTSKLLEMEETVLSNLVDFSKVLIQKFDSIEIQENFLILSYKDTLTKCNIKPNTVHIINNFIVELNQNKSDINSINELKQLPVYDKELQNNIKDYIDDLVFVLYFQIDLQKIGFENKSTIKEECSRNEFYELVI